MPEHTDACEEARAGHFFMERDAWIGLVLTDRPDPYPNLQDLGPLEQEAVLTCPHVDHDVVRLFCQRSLP